MKTVWYVSGANPDSRLPILFDTKMAAEIYARMEFPDESPDKRYARIYYSVVWEEQDVIDVEKGESK